MNNELSQKVRINLIVALSAVVVLGFSSAGHSTEVQMVKAPVKTVIPADEGTGGAQGQSQAPTKFTASEPKIEGIWTPDAENYPEGALRQAYQDELAHAASAAQAERDLEEKKAQFENKKNEAQREIEIKKKKIMDYQLRKEKVAVEVDVLNTELANLEGNQSEVEKELNGLEKQLQVVQVENSGIKAGLEQKKAVLERFLDVVKSTRLSTSKGILSMQLEMEKMRSQSATIETDIARLENEKTRAEADELEVKSKWAALKGKVEDLRQAKLETLSEVAQVKLKLDSAKNEYRLAAREFDLADKERQKLKIDSERSKTQMLAQMHSLESATVTAKTQKVEAEAERLKYFVEAESLSGELKLAKARKEEAVKDLAEAQGLVMESRLSIGRAKSELSQDKSATDTAILKTDTKKAVLRKVASALNAQGGGPSGQIFTLTRNCKIRKSPSTTAQQLGVVSAGRQIVGAPSVDGFIKIIDGGGQEMYLHSSCGKALGN